jgi:hypothetical protein
VKPEASGREDVDEDSDNDQVTIAATWVEIDVRRRSWTVSLAADLSYSTVSRPSLHSMTLFANSL